MIRIIWGVSFLFFTLSTLRKLVKYQFQKKAVRKNNQLIETLGNKLCNSATGRSALNQLRRESKFRLFSIGWTIYFSLLLSVTLFVLIYPALAYTKVWGITETIKALF